MRKLIDKYGVYIGIGTLLLAVVIFLTLGRRKHVATPSIDLSKGFFIDEQTNQESVHSLDEIPPLPGKNGNLTVVRAMKYQSPDGKQSRIVYLLKYDPETQARFNAAPAGSAVRSQILEGRSGQMVRSPEPGRQWISSDSPEGRQIKQPPEGWQLSIPQQ